MLNHEDALEWLKRKEKGEACTKFFSSPEWREFQAVCAEQARKDQWAKDPMGLMWVFDVLHKPSELLACVFYELGNLCALCEEFFRS